MAELILQSNLIEPRPLPQVDAAIRPGERGDIPFIDSLQKLHTKQVGWMPTATFEGKIRLGHVIVAESNGERVGYCIGNDQYFKRDDVGIIYQMNVLPGRQRGLIGATLLKAMFDRAAYGCRLFCCWCAQDIAANRFWESMGFVALAYRAGSEKKGPKGSARVHIFWQKRIRGGDTGDVARGGTPWWFPSKTAGGSIREDRIVLPIPPGTHWSDAKPLILPNVEPGRAGFNPPRLVDIEDGGLKPALRKKEARAAKPIAQPAAIRRNGLMFDIPKQGEPLPETKIAKSPKPKIERMKRKSDPRLAAAARELRDRWLEQVNATGGPTAIGKYEVSRAIEGPIPLPIPGSITVEMIDGERLSIEPAKLLSAA